MLSVLVVRLMGLCCPVSHIIGQWPWGVVLAQHSSAVQESWLCLGVGDSCWKSKVVTRQMHTVRSMAQPRRFRCGQFQSKLNSERWTVKAIFRGMLVFPEPSSAARLTEAMPHRKRYKPCREQLLGRARRHCSSNSKYSWKHTPPPPPPF